MSAIVHRAINHAENPYPCYAWRLERCSVRVRWLAVPACFVTLLLSPRLSAPVIGLLAGSPALGNLGIDCFLRRDHDAPRLWLLALLVTGLEWGAAVGTLGACSHDFSRTAPAMPAILLALVVIGTVRYGFAGFSGALGETITQTRRVRRW